MMYNGVQISELSAAELDALPVGGVKYPEHLKRIAQYRCAATPTAAPACSHSRRSSHAVIQQHTHTHTRTRSHTPTRRAAVPSTHPRRAHVSQVPSRAAGEAAQRRVRAVPADQWRRSRSGARRRRALLARVPARRRWLLPLLLQEARVPRRGRRRRDGPAHVHQRVRWAPPRSAAAAQARQAG
eukprot:7376330-Prymnesium_polylepis.2